MFDNITNSCHYLLNHFPEAKEVKDYLDDRLSISSQSKFLFGYYPSLDKINILIELVGKEALEHTKLLFSKDIEDSLSARTIVSSYFEDYPLVMPFRDAHGNILALVGRTLLSEQDRLSKKIPKYKNTTPFKKGKAIFGLYECKESIIKNNCVYIVEGQFDAIKAMEIGLSNVVAIGTNSMTAYQFALITRYTDNLILVLDNDEAGKKGRQSLLKKYNKLANIKNLYVPEPYKDIDEYISNEKITNINQLFLKD